MRKNIIAILALLISLGNAGYIVYNKIVTKNKHFLKYWFCLVRFFREGC